ncbi:SDR family oxidoreductase [Rhizobium laguerreae]|nr:SDR family oxidoreductase [Rhizobium laguerreae]MBY3451779.1 SDR family oxidoreductase [Rhizobium laguerreae]MBY3458947.1 SDR family oxidoreductase [Rhizobium laguerreae]
MASTRAWRSFRRWAEVAATIPYGRFADPNEVAQVAIFLASQRAEYVVGQTFMSTVATC